MPCRDYGSDWYNATNKWDSCSTSTKLKERADKLARIACVALTALEKFDPELKELVKNHELRKWWGEHKRLDKERILKEEKEKAKKAEVEKSRKLALAKLTPEEIEAFGLKVKK